MGHLVYGVEAGLKSIQEEVEGENSTSGPQPYRAEITNQITPEIPTFASGSQTGLEHVREPEAIST